MLAPQAANARSVALVRAVLETALFRLMLNSSVGPQREFPGRTRGVEQGARVLVDNRDNGVPVELTPLSVFRVAEHGLAPWITVSVIH